MKTVILFIIAVFVNDTITANKFVHMIDCLKEQIKDFLKRQMKDCPKESNEKVSLTFIAAGYIDKNYEDFWSKFTLLSQQPHIIRFKTNKGKSSYINSAIQLANDLNSQYNYILTMDCDIQILADRDGILVNSTNSFESLLRNMISVITNESGQTPNCGIVAPNQIGSNRHLSTIYQHKININTSHHILNQIIYWSELHPSIAGGFWMFTKSTYDMIGPFRNVGSYGPEDVIFAWDVVQKLKLRCYLINNIAIYHPE